MKITRTVRLVLMLSCVVLIGHVRVTASVRDEVLHIISVFKSRDPAEIAKVVSYPLNLPSPIEPVENETEMVARFNDILDSKTVDIIGNSHYESDWVNHYEDRGGEGVNMRDEMVWATDHGKIFYIRSDALKKTKTRLLKAHVADIIAAFKSRDKLTIANVIAYPFELPAPMVSVENKDEMVAHFNEIFDPETMALVASSNIDSDWINIDCSADPTGYEPHFPMFGYRVMATDQGKIMGMPSKAVCKTVARLIDKEKKQKGHPSIGKYRELYLVGYTKKRTIRLYLIKDSPDRYKRRYRYVCWLGRKTADSKPDLVIDNGFDVGNDGQVDYSHYIFKNGDMVTIVSEGAEGNSWGNLYVREGAIYVESECIISATRL